MTKELFFGAKFRTLTPYRWNWGAGNPISDPHDIHKYTDRSQTDQEVEAWIYGPNSKTSITKGKSEFHEMEIRGEHIYTLASRATSWRMNQQGRGHRPPSWPRALLWCGVVNYIIPCENLGRKVDRTLFVLPTRDMELTNLSVQRNTNLLSKRQLYLLFGHLSGHHLVNYHLTKLRLSSDAE